MCFGGGAIFADQVLAIIGVGLIGGSVGLAAKSKGLFREVRGTTSRRSSLEAALELGAIDRGFDNAGEAARGADVVLVATGVSLIPSLCLECAAVAGEGAVITDAGSVKGSIEQAVRRGMPAGRYFIGSHPLAGSERRGAANASAELLSGATCVITPSEDEDEAACGRLSGFWQALGMKVFRMSPAEHDAIMSSVSHLPHLVACALIDAVPDGALPFGASGLRDTTRVAAGDALIWRDIFESNQEEILSALSLFEDSMEKIKGFILRGDFAGLEELLRAVADKRRRRFPAGNEGGES